MRRDVTKLQDLNADIANKCVIGQSDRAHMKKESLFRPFSPEVVAFQVRLVYDLDRVFVSPYLFLIHLLTLVPSLCFAFWCTK